MIYLIEWDCFMFICLKIKDLIFVECVNLRSNTFRENGGCSRKQPIKDDTCNKIIFFSLKIAKSTLQFIIFVLVKNK